MSQTELPEAITEATQPICRLEVPPLDNVDPDVRKIVETHGGDNWLRAFALSAGAFKRFMTYYNDIFNSRKGRLPLRERELIGVVVSAENGCGYCEMNHLRGLSRALKDSVRARRIALDHHTVDLSARERGIAELALKITRDPKTVEPADFDRLRDLGMDDEEILEVIEMASWFNHSNRIAISMGIVPDEKFFQPEWVR
jgi:uncharacterized peroxidase-related enzyme